MCDPQEVVDCLKVAPYKKREAIAPTMTEPMDRTAVLAADFLGFSVGSTGAPLQVYLKVNGAKDPHSPYLK